MCSDIYMHLNDSSAERQIFSKSKCKYCKHDHCGAVSLAITCRHDNLHILPTGTKEYLPRFSHELDIAKAG